MISGAYFAYISFESAFASPEGSVAKTCSLSAGSQRASHSGRERDRVSSRRRDRDRESDRDRDRERETQRATPACHAPNHA